MKAVEENPMAFLPMKWGKETPGKEVAFLPMKAVEENPMAFLPVKWGKETPGKEVAFLPMKAVEEESDRSRPPHSWLLRVGRIS